MRALSQKTIAKAFLWFAALSGAYLYAFPGPNLFYISISLAHIALGVVAVLAAPFLIRTVRLLSRLARAGVVLLILGAIDGVIVMVVGGSRPHLEFVYLHSILSFAGVLLLLANWLRSKQWFASAAPRLTVQCAVMFLVAALLVVGAHYWRVKRWAASTPIRNPEIAPAEMTKEGDGPSGLFFPSSAQTTDGKFIPAKYFMESQACERCHKDVYEQWSSSAHHFSSFNNQWYRKSIEYMQDVVGTRPSKWCGGCHDPSVLYSGMMDTPIKQIVHTPEANAGLGCLMCHSITKVKSTMGQGDFVLLYPKLHELAASKNPVMRWLHDYSVYVNPEPHRRAFFKPFMHNEQSAEFCSSCHKVHLDVPVNHYRWIRGFNDYDNWQASGVSGLGARSFYYPAKPQRCLDCHMPLVESADYGTTDGKLHSHRFPAANTALPFANQDEKQMQAVLDFLKNGIISVDMFGISPEAKQVNTSAALPGELSTTFAVGEEAESSVRPSGAETSGSEAFEVTAPLNEVHPALRRGDTERLDVVVRTRKVGHFFPAGTVDGFDVWLELKATDDKGQVLFWSGRAEDNGKGPVEKSAHFYRSQSIDEHGNPINKRNAWSNRALVYVRLIPPGAADTVHYRLRIPENAGDKIKFEAKLNYRKFSWYYTQFSYAGKSTGEAHQMAPGFDDRKVSFDADMSGVSGNLKYIPDLPIVTIASDEVTLPVVAKSAPKPEPKRQLEAKDWERWNDYGIGLFLQGDLKSALAAFQTAAEADPARADSYVNMGRVLVQEGDEQRAKQVLEKALAIDNSLARTHYFYARALRIEGKYDEALQHLRIAQQQYPQDRVVIDDIGRILFLQRKYQDAVNELKKTLAIDPEDLQANYNLMLSYRGLGDTAQAAEYQKRYLRFKADEAAQALTGPYRLAHPEDNNERQTIHEHESAPLAIPARQTRTATLKSKRRSVASSGSQTISSFSPGHR
ncbi:MAG TPA: tetratricopeptide repeat protein [Terriglobales bacterium]|jgi:tetratricopeptide (TPR) repeat protein|nr:tetratricopeptide repeat protein [Terriglobales bacterium]